MAEEEPYLPHQPYNFDIDPLWDPLIYPPMSHSNSLRTVTADGPYLQIIEQPKQRGFRFRYGCEGPSHGGLPGASSEKNRKSYPNIKICNYQGLARVVVQLVTNSKDAHLHAHSLVGKQCDKGICIADLQPKDSSISFPNLGILHVTKKNVSKTLEDRMSEAYRMGYNCGIVIHPEMDAFQGEFRIPRELTDHQRNLISSAASYQAKEMDLSVVRLMFTAFLPDSDGGFSRRLDPVISDPIFDSKAPNASNLKIVRMDRTAGCVTGGEEVYLLCDKVQKGFFQGYSTYNNYGTSYSSGFSPGMSGGGAGIKHAPQGRAEDSGDDSDMDDDPASGAVVGVRAKSEDASAGETSEERGAGVELGPGDRTGECVLEARLVENAERQAEALFQYAVTGDVSYLLAPQRQLMTAQDENGDTGLHLGVIHSQTDAVRSLAQVLSALPGEEVLNMRNNLYQTPLHLAVITQQKAVAEALLLAGADVTLSDRHGNTALHLAAQQKEGGMVGFLLKRREMVELVDLPNAAGLCSLHLAVLANSLCSLRDLLVSGGSVEVQERSCGRTALHLATELDNVSLAGCLLLEGDANVDCCTYNGSSPLHTATGRGSVKLTALLMAAGADPHKENFEPLFFREHDCCVDEEEEDEGYIPGTTPLNMAATPEVLEILNGKEYKPESNTSVFVPPQGDMQSLGSDTKRTLCQALECPEGGWESLAHILGLGILNSAFRLSSSPASTLLDSYEVSGGKVKDLLEGLRTVGNCSALTVLDGALCETEQAPPATQSTTKLLERVCDLKLDGWEDSGVCDSGVELSTA